MDQTSTEAPWDNPKHDVLKDFQQTKALMAAQYRVGGIIYPSMVAKPAKKEFKLSKTWKTTMWYGLLCSIFAALGPLASGFVGLAFLCFVVGTTTGVIAWRQDRNQTWM